LGQDLNAIKASLFGQRYRIAVLFYNLQSVCDLCDVHCMVLLWDEIVSRAIQQQDLMYLLYEQKLTAIPGGSRYFPPVAGMLEGAKTG
jgi:hypothetical protein